MVKVVSNDFKEVFTTAFQVFKVQKSSGCDNFCPNLVPQADYTLMCSCADSLLHPCVTQNLAKSGSVSNFKILQTTEEFQVIDQYFLFLLQKP